MRIEYDPQADALYIRFRAAAPAENLDIEDGVTVDFDSERRIIGIEFLSVSRRLPADALSSITVQNLVGGAS
jgi:uncharacterized protein YuzE